MMNTAVIASLLQKIFPGKSFQDGLRVEVIGGMTNRNFKVSFGDKSYALRIPGKGTEGMIARKNEKKNTLLAYRMGISPEMHYSNEDTGIKLTSFVEGAETLNHATIQQANNVLQIADILQTLHCSRVHMENEFDVFREILSYERLLDKSGGRMYEGYDAYRKDIFAFSDRLDVFGTKSKPCHNDLVPENFIKDANGRLYLVDWEYAGMNDPIWDFASLFIESNFTESNRILMLEKCFEVAVTNEVEEKILLYQVLMDILWSIWARIKESSGDDFGPYGKLRYDRAIENLKKIK